MNNWGEMTIDTQRGIAYIPLGSPTYDFYGADRIGANLFGTSIVALDARTGKRLLALPDRAPRPLGSRPQRGAAAHDDPPQRPQPRRRRVPARPGGFTCSTA